MTKESNANSVVRRSSFRPYPGYKPTGEDWIRQIPSHWRYEKLKHIASIQTSNVDKKTEDGETPVRLCNYVDVYYNDTIDTDMTFMNASATAEEINKFSLRSDDVLITKDSESWDDIAIPAHVQAADPDVLCGYHLAQIRPNERKLSGAFLARAFSATGIRNQFWVSANGVTRYGLSRRWIDNAQFPFPPFEEQERIAEFLDRETGKIDGLVAKKEELIKLLQEKRTALITHAVTKGLDPNAPMKDSDIEWLGEIPAHWGYKPLRWSCTVKSGEALSHEQIKSEPADDTWSPVVGGNGVMGYSERANLESPEIAIGRVVAHCGNVHLVQPPTWITDNALLVSEIDGFERRYLALVLKCLNLNSWASQNAQPLITGDLVKSQKVCVPPVDEQRAIVSLVQENSKAIDSLIEVVRSGIERLVELRTALISAAVTGKIDVREEVA